MIPRKHSWNCWVSLIVLTISVIGCVSNARLQSHIVDAQVLGVNEETMSRLKSGAPLHIEDLQELARKKAGDSTIQHFVEIRRQIFRLSTREIDSLRQAGVSDTIIDYLLSTPQRFYPKPAVTPTPGGLDSTETRFFKPGL